MDDGASGAITVLLTDLRQGREDAVEELVAVVYRELRTMAAAMLRREVGGHTLRTVDLVHEAYLRLFDQERLEWDDRRHFFGSVAVAMRRVLVDHARRRRAGKRIPRQNQLPIEHAEQVALPADVDLVVLDEALDRLADAYPRQARVVELRYFGGLSESEVAEVLETSRQTVARDWRAARLWLRREMRA